MNKKMTMCCCIERDDSLSKLVSRIAPQAYPLTIVISNNENLFSVLKTDSFVRSFPFTHRFHLNQPDARLYSLQREKILNPPIIIADVTCRSLLFFRFTINRKIFLFIQPQRFSSLNPIHMWDAFNFSLAPPPPECRRECDPYQEEDDICAEAKDFNACGRVGNEVYISSDDIEACLSQMSVGIAQKR